VIQAGDGSLVAVGLHGINRIPLLNVAGAK
jgi:hypothetical protein